MLRGFVLSVYSSPNEAPSVSISNNSFFEKEREKNRKNKFWGEWINNIDLTALSLRKDLTTGSPSSVGRF